MPKIWYYNLALRAGVYACAAAEGQDEVTLSIPLKQGRKTSFSSLRYRYQDSPIFQLALTFAALQTSETKYYDPTGLVNALRLDTGNHQDASECVEDFVMDSIGTNGIYVICHQVFEAVYDAFTE